MKKNTLPRLIWTGIVLAFCAAPAFASDATVSGAWVRATAPGQDSASVSMRITARKNAKLIAASSPAAAQVEIHLMKHEQGMMTMRKAESLELPAGQEVALESGSHLMLVGLKQPLKAGDKVRLDLTLEYAGKLQEVIPVTAEVRALTASHGMENMHDMEDMPGMKHPPH